MGDGGTAAEEYAVGVGRHDLPPLLVRDLRLRGRCVVDQHDGASRPSYHVVDCSRVRDVHDKGERKVGWEFSDDIFQRIAPAIDEGDLCAFS